MNFNQIPKSGYLLIYFQDGVEFQAYADKVEVQELVNNWEQTRNMLEAHFFDADTEYRWLHSRRKGVIEALITDEMEGETNHNIVIVERDGKWKEIKQTVFEESVLVLPSFSSVMPKIRFISYLEYDQNDMLKIKGYRLAPEREVFNNGER